jgi:hypothetical protein
MDNDAFAQINAFGGVDYAPHNKGITPVFFLEPILDAAATEREGHTVYREKERVRIHIAGDPLSAATHPVDASIIARFRDQYEKWKRDKTGEHINGMPLSKWPMATPVLIRELESLNIFSVEDLAGVSDANVANFTDGRAIREKAIAWLASAKDSAASMRYAAEAQRLRDEMAELKKMVEAAGVKDSAPVAKAILRREKIVKSRKPKRKSVWTPERRAAASAAMKSRHAQAVEWGETITIDPSLPPGG